MKEDRIELWAWPAEEGEGGWYRTWRVPTEVWTRGMGFFVFGRFGGGWDIFGKRFSSREETQLAAERAHERFGLPVDVYFGQKPPAEEMEPNARGRLRGKALEHARERTRRARESVARREAAWAKATAGMSQQQIAEKFFPTLAPLVRDLPPSYYVRTQGAEFGPFGSVDEARDMGDASVGPGQYSVVRYR